MLCNICHKEQATHHHIVIVNDKKTEMHLCEKCASKKGLIPPLEKVLSPFHFLSGMLEQEKVKEDESIRCPKCGLSYQEFTKNAKFGCAECYTAFSKKITPLLKKLHGNTNYAGKIAMQTKGTEKKAQIYRLKRKLEEVIKQENYEQAAKIKNEIEKLKTL